MSDVNIELIEKMADIPLPLSIKFNSKTIRLESLLSADEAPFRNKTFIFKNFAGKKGKLMLCNIELSPIMVVADGDDYSLKFENAEILEQLDSAITYGELTLTGTAGRAQIPASMIPEIKSGSIIALENSPDDPASIIIPEIDWVIFKGETVNIDSFFGIRITETEGYTRQDPAGAVVTGDALLGNISINPASLGAYGIGTIVKFDNPNSHLTFRLSDGSQFRGFLQSFSREELMKLPTLINDIQSGTENLILCFRVTSITNTENETQRASDKVQAAQDSLTPDLSIDSVFSSLSDSRIKGILSAMPRSAAIWLLKAVDSEYAAKQLMTLTLSLPEDERGRFLNSFILCRPSLTPKIIGRTVLNRLASSLDKEELAAARAYSEGFGGFGIPEKDPVKAAADIFNRYGEHEKRLLLEWLEIAGSEMLENIKNYIFLFSDITKLSDKNIQKLLREIDSADLVTALSGDEPDEDILSAFKRNISARAWKIMEEEISFNNDIALEKCFEMRDKIIGILAALEKNGSIVV